MTSAYWSIYIMNKIKTLPIELRQYIYGFIEINQRLKLFNHKHSVRDIINYSNSLHVNTSIELFVHFIKNKLVIKNGPYSWSPHHLRPELSDLTPKITYNLYSNNNPITIGHRLETNISECVSLRHMPRGHNNWIPRNLRENQRAFINETINKVHTFSTMSGDLKELQYVLKKTLLYYLIALVKYGKPKYEIKICVNERIRIRKFMKKHLFKELRKKYRSYNQSSKNGNKEIL